MIVWISLMLLTFIWVYCIVESMTLFTGELLIEDCSQEDLYKDIIDRHNSRR